MCTLVVSLLWSTSAVAGKSKAPPPPPRDVAQVRQPNVRVLDLNPAMEALENVRDGEIVYLDAVWPVTEDDNPGGCREAGFGGLPQDRDTVVFLGPPKGNNHLLLEIRPGHRADFPFNDISCEYAGGPLQGALRMRGFYVVMSTSIPTARLVRLHAVGLDPFIAGAIVQRD